MIRVIYNNPQLYNCWRVIWTSVLFISINYLVFVGFMNVCFQNLGSNQPVPLLAIALSLLSVDVLIKVFMTRKPFTVGNVTDTIAIFCLILSFSLYSLYKSLVFLQITALLKLHDTVYFNILVYNLVKKYSSTFKTYVILKIIYWVILVGHLLGCTFYAVDNYLIKQEYFGPISQNPNLYYQGSLHVYTSIYTLSQEERYIYAIYYSFSLLSTVAFGDIIGHNYFEDIMVGGFLILATIGISLIIEQMYIVFRRQKTIRYELVSKLKYVSEYIKTQPNISKQFRHDLINYMINAQWKEMTSTPNLQELTLKLQRSIFSESILSKTQDPLPLIIRMNFLPLMKSKYFPANYFLVDNNRLENHLDGRIIVNAKINVGYTRQLIGKQYIQTQCVNYGFDELVIGTNSLDRYFTVQLVEQAQVFVLSDDLFSAKMQQFKEYVNQYLPTPTEFYQISKDEAMFQKKEKYYCFSCKVKGHNLMDCPKFHYDPKNIPKIDLYFKHYKVNRKYVKRRTVKSNKNTSMKSLDQMKRQKQGLPNLFIHFDIIGRIFKRNDFFQNLLEKTIINYTQEKFINSPLDQTDSYHVWKLYLPQGKL